MVTAWRSLHHGTGEFLNDASTWEGEHGLTGKQEWGRSCDKKTRRWSENIAHNCTQTPKKDKRGAQPTHEALFKEIELVE